ncbi:RNase A-like domain-containing protein [Streptomyces sp. NPDC055103]
MAGPTPAQPPGGGGTIDVKPSDLWRVSGRVASQQSALNSGANKLLDGLRKYPDAGGAGTDAREFSQAYMKVGNRWLDVWAKSVLSVGGVAVGFTETANAYAKADAAAHPKPGQSVQQMPVPSVVDKQPDYGQIPDLKWGDDDGGDDFIRRLLELIPPVVRTVLQPLLKKALRIGKLADVYPYPQQHYLNSLSQCWSDTTICLSMVSGTLTGEVSTISNPQQTEWQDAMKVFCSAVWGATAWGHSREGYQWAQKGGNNGHGPPTGSQPVMTVLFDTAKKISDILREYAEAAVELNGDIWDEFVEAVRESAKEVLDVVDKDLNLKDGVGMKDVGGFFKTIGKGAAKGVGALAEFDIQIVLKLDTADINRIVGKYQSTLNALTARFDAMMPALDEAYLSAPKFEAGVARAHGFGARALDEFKDPQRWIKEDANGNYTLDLASNEWLNNGHTLDKHVGKTDEQLKQRLRDQQNNPGHTTPTWPYGNPRISGSSSFPTYDRAQELTQHTINDNSAAIKAWLKGPPPPDPGATELFRSKAPNDGYSGTSVSKKDDNVPPIPGRGYQNNGMNATVEQVKFVETRIKYTPGLDPEFTVLTSMPAP